MDKGKKLENMERALSLEPNANKRKELLGGNSLVILFNRVISDWIWAFLWLIKVWSFFTQQLFPFLSFVSFLSRS